MAKKHSFSHTVVEHHKDGSHTVHHIHEKHGHQHTTPERDGDVKHGTSSHDEMVDSVMDHTSEPNEGEEQAAQAAPAAGATPPPGVVPGA